MKKLGKSILYIILLVVVIIIAILIGTIIKNSYNTISKEKNEKVEQLTQTSVDNSYVNMATHLSEINNKELTLQSTTATYIAEEDINNLYVIGSATTRGNNDAVASVSITNDNNRTITEISSLTTGNAYARNCLKVYKISDVKTGDSFTVNNSGSGTYAKYFSCIWLY